MDDKVEYFQNIKRRGKPVYQWKHKEIDEYCRFFYRGFDDDIRAKTGFEFYVAEFHSVEGHAQDNLWENKRLRCECIFEGTVYWDGIRHFFAGSEETDNYGYLYYISIKRMKAALEILEDLMKEHCREYE
jgi:hypothetical protein